MDDVNFTYIVGESEASVWPGRCALHKVMCLDPEIVFVHTYMYNNAYTHVCIMYNNTHTHTHMHTHTHTHVQRECHMMVCHGRRR